MTAGAWRAGHALATELRRRLEAERDRWLLWLPVGLGSGIAIYFLLPVEPPLWLGPTGLAAALCCGLLARRHQGRLLLLLASGAILAGFTAAQIRTERVAAPVLEKRLGPTSVTGQVLAVEPRSGGGRIVLHRPTIAALGNGAMPAKVRIRLTRRDPARLAPGDWVRVRALLRPPPGPAAPGAFDFARQAYYQQLGAVGYAVGHTTRLPRDEATGSSTAASLATSWRLGWSRLRDTVARRVLAVLPDARGAIAAALMTGERGAIPEPVVEAMRDAGLAHLLAISGLHMGLVAGLLFAGIRALLALFPAVALRYPIKKWAALAAALGALAYLFLTGATVPTQRAYAMAALVILAVLLDRSAVSLRLVAWAAIVVLMVAPESLLSASFQMSFAAVAALVAGYEILAPRLARGASNRGPLRRMAVYFLGVALTSVIAILATAPFVIFHFNRMAVYGLAANLAAVPLTAFWIMPWALVTLALMPFGLEAIALHPMGWGIGAVIAVARSIAGLPGAAMPVPAMPLWGFAFVVLGGLWLCLWRKPWRLAGIAVVLLGLASIALNPAPHVLASGDGKLLAVRGTDGTIWLSSTRRGRFAAEMWLRRAGQSDGQAWSHAAGEAGLPLRCDRLGCIYRFQDQVVALAKDGRALDEDCRVASVLISLEPISPWRCRRPTVLIDRFDLWRGGSHALWLSPDGVRVESAATRRGARPWVRPRPRDSAQ